VVKLPTHTHIIFRIKMASSPPSTSPTYHPGRMVLPPLATTTHSPPLLPFSDRQSLEIQQQNQQKLQEFKKFFSYVPLNRNLRTTNSHTLEQLDRAMGMAVVRIQSTMRGSLDRARVKQLRSSSKSQIDIQASNKEFTDITRATNSNDNGNPNNNNGNNEGSARQSSNSPAEGHIFERSNSNISLSELSILQTDINNNNNSTYEQNEVIDENTWFNPIDDFDIIDDDVCNDEGGIYVPHLQMHPHHSGHNHSSTHLKFDNAALLPTIIAMLEKTTARSAGNSTKTFGALMYNNSNSNNVASVSAGTLSSKHGVPMTTPTSAIAAPVQAQPAPATAGTTTAATTTTIPLTVNAINDVLNKSVKVVKLEPLITSAQTSSKSFTPTLSTPSMTPRRQQESHIAMIEKECVYGNIRVDRAHKHKQMMMHNLHNNLTNNNNIAMVESADIPISPEGIKWVKKLLDYGRYAKVLQVIDRYVHHEQSYWSDILLPDLQLLKVECLVSIEDFYNASRTLQTYTETCINAGLMYQQRIDECCMHADMEIVCKSVEDMERYLRLLKCLATLAIARGEFSSAGVYYAKALGMFNEQKRKQMLSLSPRPYSNSANTNKHTNTLLSLYLSVENDFIAFLNLTGQYTQAQQHVYAIKALSPFVTTTDRPGECLIAAELIVTQAVCIHTHRYDNFSEAERALLVALKIQTQYVCMQSPTSSILLTPYVHLKSAHTHLLLGQLCVENYEFSKAEMHLLTALSIMNSLTNTVIDNTGTILNELSFSLERLQQQQPPQPKAHTNNNKHKSAIPQSNMDHTVFLDFGSNQLATSMLSAKYMSLWQYLSNHNYLQCNVGHAAGNPGGYSGAQGHRIVTISPPRLINEHVLMALCGLSRVLLWKGAFTQALECLQYCMEADTLINSNSSISRSVRPSNTNKQAHSHGNTLCSATICWHLGEFYRKMGFPHQSLLYHERAYNIRINLIDPSKHSSHLSIAASVCALGQTHIMIGNLALALEYFQQAVVTRYNACKAIRTDKHSNSPTLTSPKPNYKQALSQKATSQQQGDDEDEDDRELEHYEVSMSKVMLLLGQLDEAQEYIGDTTTSNATATHSETNVLQANNTNNGATATTNPQANNSNSSLASSNGTDLRASIRSCESLTVLAELCTVRGRFHDASLLYQRAIKQLTNALTSTVDGTDIPAIANLNPEFDFFYGINMDANIEMATLKLGYAQCLRQPGYYREASELTASVVNTHLRTFGLRSMHTSWAMYNHAQILRDVGQWEQAVKLYVTALTNINLALQDNNHIGNSNNGSNQSSGKHEEQQYGDIVAANTPTKSNGKTTVTTCGDVKANYYYALIMGDLGECLRRMGRLENATRVLKKGLHMRQASVAAALTSRQTAEGNPSANMWNIVVIECFLNLVLVDIDWSSHTHIPVSTGNSSVSPANANSNTNNNTPNAVANTATGNTNISDIGRAESSLVLLREVLLPQATQSLGGYHPLVVYIKASAAACANLLSLKLSAANTASARLNINNNNNDANPPFVHAGSMNSDAGTMNMSVKSASNSSVSSAKAEVLAAQYASQQVIDHAINYLLTYEQLTHKGNHPWIRTLKQYAHVILSLSGINSSRYRYANARSDTMDSISSSVLHSPVPADESGKYYVPMSPLISKVPNKRNSHNTSGHFDDTF
jgi:tetratricopeptide (TPR) repeat protein